MNHAHLPMTVVSVFMMTSCHHERADSPAPVSSHTVTSDHVVVKEIPVDIQPTTHPTTSDSGVPSPGNEAHKAADNVRERIRKELYACGAFGDIYVDRKAMPVVRSWLEAYRVGMGQEADPQIATNSTAKRALCEHEDENRFYQGACDGTDGSFFWAKFPWRDDSGNTNTWQADIIVRLNDDKFALIEKVEATPRTNSCDPGPKGHVGHVKPSVSFERSGLIHVRAHYTVVNDTKVYDTNYNECMYYKALIDVFVDPITGDRVFSYSQRLPVGRPPIESISVVDHQVTLTGPKCHVNMRLP